jgi:transketolase
VTTLTDNTLERTAASLRLNIVRMMGPNKPHHFGGSLSAADLVTALYFYKMRYDPADPAWPDRDRFLMSKGHSVPAQYAALALLGVIPVDELTSLKKLGTRLQGHPAMHYTPGIEGCTGSLGQGLSYANGMALAARLQGRSYRVYCLIGDGELQEGQVWEAAATTPKLGLTNLTALIDHNKLKAMDDSSTACKPIAPVAGRFAALGWAVREIDGHNLREICEALDWAAALQDAPAVLVAHTVKGKGISFIENQPGFHNAAMTPEQIERALAELETATQPERMS